MFFLFTGMENTENLPPTLCGSQSLTCSPASPRKAGTVFMFEGRRKIRVRLSVHYNHFERFAVVSQDKVLCKDCGYINLRNCTVRETGDNSFQIIPRDCDGNMLTFTVPSSQEVKEWLQALNIGRPQGGSPLRSARMPKQGPQTLTQKKRVNKRRQPTLLPALEEE